MQVALTGSSEARVDARKALEDQLEVHAQVIIDIKTRLNTLTPVASLPAELLSTIFTLVAAENYGRKCRMQGLNEQYAQANTWIWVAHVCRHWRSIALSSPRFWSYIIVTSKRAIEELLVRSKAAPLHILAAVPSYGAMDALERVMAAFARIRTLQLAGSSQAICELFKSVSAPAAMLQSMTISDRNWVYDTGIMPLVLPADGFPQLRNLEINGFPFAWDHPLFPPTLTTLLIHGRIGFEARQLIGSFDAFLSALEELTNLQELLLEHAIPQAPVTPPTRKIHLIHLSSLRVVAGETECSGLLDHLTLPSNVRYHVTVDQGAPGPGRLFSALQPHLSSSSPIRRACFDEILTGGVALHGWHAELQPTELAWVHHPQDLQLEIIPEIPMISTLLQASAIFSAVTDMEIRVDGDQWRWTDVFAGMPNVRRLSVYVNQDAEFLEALSHTVGDEPAALTLPRLEVLKLSYMRVGSWSHDRPNEFLDDMADVLIKRCNYGSPLQELHINHCTNTYRYAVNILAEIVPELKWDGVEEGFEGDSDYSNDDDFRVDLDDWNHAGKVLRGLFEAWPH